MGDIPERSLFRKPVLKKALVPYFQIVQGKLWRQKGWEMRILTSVWIGCP